MVIRYRKLFLKDLKKVVNQTVYDRIVILAFQTLPQINSLREISDIKKMKTSPSRFRIRIGDYRIGIEVHNSEIEVLRVLHRKDFYNYFR